MPKNSEEQPEADRRHNQEVHGGDAGRMVAEKSLLGLRRPSPTPRHVLGDGRLRDLDPKLKQFAMDARRSPQPIGQAHVPDQAPNLHWKLWPTAARARLPPPVMAKAGAMPPDDSVGLEWRSTPRKQSIKPDQDHSVSNRQSWLRRSPSTQNVQLMSENQDLGFQPRLRLER